MQEETQNKTNKISKQKIEDGEHSPKVGVELFSSEVGKHDTIHPVWNTPEQEET